MSEAEFGGANSAARNPHMDIWEEWQNLYRKLGVVRPIWRDGELGAGFSMAKPRILFVLKEPNAPPPKEPNAPDLGGSLADFFINGPNGQAWYNVSRWAAGLLRGLPDFRDVCDPQVMKESLHHVAAVNLKKIGGGGASWMPAVNAYAFAGRELLLRQIDDISPEVIVACGTFDILVWLLEPNLRLDKPDDPIYVVRRHAWVIPFRHPARAGKEKSYAELIEVVKSKPELLDLIKQAKG